MSRFCDVFHGMKPTILMILNQVAAAGVNVFYKLACNDGMKVSVLVAYRFMFGSVAVVPLALYFDRNKRPKLTWKVLFQAFTVALFGGSLAQNMYAKSLIMTSATFAAATTNLIPAITFIMAVIFRLEKFDLKSWGCRAKVTGTLICMGGAMLLTLYKGVAINLWSTHSGLLHHREGHVATFNHNIVGPLLAIASVFSFTFALIIQANISKSYPCHFSSTALICLMGTAQSVVYALCVERKNWNAWRLGANIRLLTVAYSGITASGFVVIVMMYCVRMRGPLFVSVFSPLMLIMVAVAGSLFLDESLHLGSVIGALVIIVGLYVVLWGKSKEMKKVSRPTPSLPERFSGDHRQSEMINSIAENEREVNSCCNMVALGVVPSFLPSTASNPTQVGSSSVAPNDDGEHDLEDQGLYMDAKNRENEKN